MKYCISIKKSSFIELTTNIDGKKGMNWLDINNLE